MKIYKITWLDITTVYDWTNKTQALFIPCTECESVGFLLSEDKKFIRLAHNINNDEECDITIIPKGCIIKKQCLS